MFYRNGILEWTWDSATATDPEPIIPEDTQIFYSINLTGP
jgi:hypothetical protein